MAISSRSVIPTRFQGISDNYGQLHAQFVRTGAVVPYNWFGYNQEGNQENGYIILLFFRIELFLLGRSRIGVGAGVGVDIFWPESELESFEIRQLRRPALNHCILVISGYTRVAWLSYSCSIISRHIRALWQCWALCQTFNHSEVSKHENIVMPRPLTWSWPR